MSEPYCSSYDIRPYERNQSGSVPFYQLSNFLQDIAGLHATALGWSVDALLQEGKSWVLSRMNIDIDEPVTATDRRLLLKTWPCGADRMYAYRAFTLEREGGHRIGKALTYWVLLDVAKRRPVPMPQEIADLAGAYPEPPISVTKNRLELPAQQNRVFSVRVLPSDLDINGHVNNAVYIRWIEDALHMYQLDPAGFKRLDVLYKAEVKLQETVEVILDQSNPEVVQIGVVRGEDPVCIAELRR